MTTKREPREAWKVSRQDQKRWDTAVGKLPPFLRILLRHNLLHGEELEFARIVKVSEACAKEVGGCDNCPLEEICTLGWDLRVRHTGKLREYVETMRNLRQRI